MPPYSCLGCSAKQNIRHTLRSIARAPDAPQSVSALLTREHRSDPYFSGRVHQTLWHLQVSPESPPLSRDSAAQNRVHRESVCWLQLLRQRPREPVAAPPV